MDRLDFYINYWTLAEVNKNHTVYRRVQPNNRGQNMKCIYIMVEEEEIDVCQKKWRKEIAEFIVHKLTQFSWY